MKSNPEGGIIAPHKWIQLLFLCTRLVAVSNESRTGAAGAQYEDGMTLEELRDQIDVLDRQLVELLSERARAAQMIGHLKAATSLPVYEPAREK